MSKFVPKKRTGSRRAVGTTARKSSRRGPRRNPPPASPEVTAPEAGDPPETLVERHVAGWILARRRGLTFEASEARGVHPLDINAVMPDARAAIAGMRDMLDRNLTPTRDCQKPCPRFDRHMRLCFLRRGHRGDCECPHCHEAVV